MLRGEGSVEHDAGHGLAGCCERSCVGASEVSQEIESALLRQWRRLCFLGCDFRGRGFEHRLFCLVVVRLCEVVEKRFGRCFVSKTRAAVF